MTIELANAIAQVVFLIGGFLLGYFIRGIRQKGGEERNE